MLIQIVFYWCALTVLQLHLLQVHAEELNRLSIDPTLARYKHLVLESLIVNDLTRSWVDRTAAA